MNRKLYHLIRKQDLNHCYYATLVALVRETKDLGVSKGTLDRFDFSKPYENEKYIIHKSIVMR